MQIIIKREQLKDLIVKLETSAEVAMLSIANLAAENDALSFLYECKFHANGFNPLESTVPMNFIEQINQTFTYLASFRGAEYIFRKHLNVKHLLLNLGTSSGFDIESHDSGEIVAEVFASVDPSNNQKLKKDTNRVAKSKAQFKYVFFIAPQHPFSEKTVNRIGCDVHIISLGGNFDGLDRMKA